MKPAIDSKAAEGQASPTPMQRARALTEVLVVALGGYAILLLMAPAFQMADQDLMSMPRLLVWVLVVEATLSMAFVFLFMYLNGEQPAKFGLLWRRPVRETAIAFLVVPILFLGTVAVGLSFRQFFPEYVTEENPLLQIIQSRDVLMLFLFSSVYVGGFKEEIQRAFVLVRFGEFLGGYGVGLAIWTVFFGVGHLIQGVDNAFGAGLLGLIFGLLFLWRKCLIAPILAHAVYDIAVLLIFWNVLV